MHKYIITITSRAAIGPMTAHEYGFEGVIAQVVAPHGNVTTITVDSTEVPIMGTVLDHIKQMYLVGGCHGWKSEVYVETEGTNVCASLEVITAEFETD
jgi:hypothetical protein